jgi:hypothetical protein
MGEFAPLSLIDELFVGKQLNPYRIIMPDGGVSGDPYR